MSEQEHPFQPGVTVVVTKGWGGAHKIAMGRVANVHKTGRFTIEGSAQQYRAFFDDATKEWRGNQTGSSYYPLTVYLPSPKREAKEQMERLTDDFRLAIVAIEKETAGGRYRRVASAATLSAANALLAAINAEKGSNADAA